MQSLLPLEFYYSILPLNESLINYCNGDIESLKEEKDVKIIACAPELKFPSNHPVSFGDPSGQSWLPL
jgi:hypothetical protein